MTVNSVAPARTSAPGAIDPHTSGSGTDGESSVFEALLADAHHAATETPTSTPHDGPEASDPADSAAAAAARRRHALEHNSTDHKAVDAGDDADDNDDQAPKKPAPTEHEALLAALAALAFMTPDTVTATPDTVADANAPADGVAPSTDLLTDLPVPELSVADDATPVEPVVTPEFDVAAALSTSELLAPATPAEEDSQIASARAIPPRPPAPAPRPVATDASDDVAPTGTRTASSATHGINGPGDAARPQPATAPAPGTTPVAPPVAPTAIAVDASANDVTTAVATTAPPPPAEQLVSVLSPLRTSPNGSYSLRLELRPVELGRIEMRVEMRDGVLHASIHADHEGSAQLVRATLGELRSLLAAEGVRTGDLTVSDGALGWNGRDGRNANQAGGDRASRSSEAPTAGPTDRANSTRPGTIPTTTDSEATSLLDVRV